MCRHIGQLQTSGLRTVFNWPLLENNASKLLGPCIQFLAAIFYKGFLLLFHRPVLAHDSHAAFFKFVSTSAHDSHIVSPSFFSPSDVGPGLTCTFCIFHFSDWFSGLCDDFHWLSLILSDSRCCSLIFVVPEFFGSHIRQFVQNQRYSRFSVVSFNS